MKLSCQLSPWGSEHQQGMACMQDNNIHHIEVGSNLLWKYERDIPAWKELLLSYQLQVSAVFEFGHFDSWSRRREIYWHHDRLASMLAKSQIPLVILGPGLKYNKVHTVETAQHVMQMINEIAKRYDDKGIKTAIHPHFGHCIFTKSEIDAVMDGVASHIGLIPDIGHLAEANIDILSFIRNYFPRIFAIHLKDYVKINPVPNKKIQRKVKFVPLGQGNFDFFSLFQLLKQKDFTAWLTLEMDEIERDQLQPLCARSLQFMEPFIINKGAE
ncbi:sugar phosphate isomerase/epimerase family protein [Longirhabdus pacifica]|uniref:sugar phosphate isomerase/epimerase family protein n=1 Tax=Longirhabdus pacifica TaxID=2305227 RepID=UPI001008F7B2|nr:sugar phosphate isomerase/epimerase [Longirhabdus pacifica]